LSLGGIGVIVDRVIGSIGTDEYVDMIAKSHNLGNAAKDKSSQSAVSQLNNIELDDAFMNEIGNESKNSLKNFNQIVANIGDNEYTPIEIVLLNTPTYIWQPQRWQSRGQSLLNRR
jgi:hypothetical protein